MHGHGGPGGGPAGTGAVLSGGEWAVAAVLAAAVLAYGAGVVAVWVRGTDWPAGRLALWTCGWLCAGAALLGPVAERAHRDFAAHMAGHVLLGMLAPLLLVLAAPVTLALRALPRPSARALARLLASRAAAVPTHPLTAAVLSVGGLWALYPGGLYAAASSGPWGHAAVHAHVLASGYLFAFAVLGGPDPAPHRPSPPWRAAVLVAAIAAHNVLAKTVYAVPPPGVDPERARAGAEVMYYGGAPVEIALIVLLCAAWLGPRPAPAARPGQAGGRGAPARRGPSALTPGRDRRPAARSAGRTGGGR
ncbi:cytochrome c oxidase assembly protein [Streptomonospora nanhaiensis]|uniref:Putative membrane protein n=1 Tax=Streptomonospora nanhaiensis TaxID=1323731 RepID=A0A853BQL8_9ACTN|nr:cytochrome c oxidase assembly protein [Streptomonospora nanhaiensis]MBX9389863.1 cytochrome c oxidase assembly protein [Streptomonospora nanhaiensis]NYI96857.1 putative membrane protein [Streptomonospora nanhaiensis]